MTDMELLRQYVLQNSEDAFAALVARHVNLVFSAALRKTGSTAAAEEITQAVFVILARKAGRLGAGTVLSGWLYHTARLTTASYLRTQIRRAHREQEAYMQSLTDEPVTKAWQEIEPLLEDGMGRLGEKDRNAIVLRFLDGKSFQEIGAAVGSSENAAKKRVAHALEKLRKFFTKRGVHSTSAIIAGAISANSIQAAPVGLAKTISAVAITKGATASLSTLTLIKGALKIMAWTKMKSAVVVAVAVLLAAGTTTVTVKEIENHNDDRWDTGRIDSRILDHAPHIVKIIPTKHSNNGGWAGSNYRMLGIRDDLKEIIQATYGVGATRTVYLTTLSQKKYDFISNVNSPSNDALKQEIKKQFGVVARTETIETNVLFLRVKQPGAPGLKKTATHDSSSSSINNGEFQFINQPAAQIAAYAENTLDIPVIDETGLKGSFDIDLKWDQNNRTDNFKQALTDQLGLELVPGTAPVDFLIVEKE